MTPGRLILLGVAVAAAGILLAAFGAGMGGPLNPSCAGFRAWTPDCASASAAASLALKIAGLPVMVTGGILVAIGLARREPPPDEPAR